LLRLTIFKKILSVTLLLSLLPLLISSLVLLSNIESVSSRLTEEVAHTSDIQAAESLQMRAQHVAETISDFLRQCEGDLLFLASSQISRQTLHNFYTTRRSDVWERLGPDDDIRKFIPIYHSIAVIDKDGKEQLVIQDGLVLPTAKLRNVSIKTETEYKSEDYFYKTKALHRGEVYVSHLTGFHVSKQEQLAGTSDPKDAYSGRAYEGVIRFSSPLFDSHGAFNGIVVISLDHRHLIEFTQHIDPGRNFSTLFPSYKSGNYAFLFDDEGWIIAHPKYWDMRGLNRDGSPVPPYTINSNQADIDSGRIPFNLDKAGFVHANYPLVADAVRNHKNGYVDVTNIDGAKKIMSYAPILYSTGEYGKYGVFGGVTIGFQADQFHDPAISGSRLIRSELREYRILSTMILLFTALVAGITGWALSNGITRPLQQLILGARRLAEGDTKGRVTVSSTDELGELATTFNIMSDELETRKTSLLTTLDELRRSRLEILDERNFKESILESISSAIVTFSPEGLLTSINATGRLFLGDGITVDMHFRDVFCGWDGMEQCTEHALVTHSGYGRQAMYFERNDGRTHFDVGFFPISKDAEYGVTVTMRNETEKEKLREEMIRLDRLASLGKLSAGIAHEVRNPLTGISLLLDDLHDNAALAGDDQNMIKKAVAEIERVERLINALLNYSSPARVDFRVGSLNAVVNDTVLLMRRQCEKQKVSVLTDVGELSEFCFDPEKIKQALMNLVRNAVEAMPGGGKVSIATRAVEDHVLLTVSDNGPGIRAENLPLIFEPFFTSKGAGTGLGLSITQRIIVEHHGQISVESSGTGTTFTLWLPLLSSSSNVSKE
jgi:signal transduction histidine kinase